MAWGSPSAHSKVPLKYRFLAGALRDKRLSKRGNLDMIVLGPNTEGRWSKEDNVAIDVTLHTHRILTFHPDGRIQMYMAGRPSNLTRHWLYQAVPRHISKRRPNKWTDHVWLYRDQYLFHEGMTVDGNKDYELIGNPMPIWMNVPSAQAKQLRKRVLQQLEEVYMPHLRMLSIRGEQRIPMQFSALPTLAQYFQPKDEGILVLDMCTSNPSTTHEWGEAIKLFKDGMDRMYEKHVLLLKLFDAVPYQPKEK